MTNGSSDMVASSTMSPPSMLSADCNCVRSPAPSNAVPSGPSCAKSKSTRSAVARASATPTAPARSSSRPCSAPLRPSSSGCSEGIVGPNDIDSGCGFGEETLDGSSSLGRMGSDTSRDIGSGATDGAWSSCSTSSSPSTTSGSSGRGASGSLTSPSSSLNCCSIHIASFGTCHFKRHPGFGRTCTLSVFTHLRTLRVDPGAAFSGVTQTFSQHGTGCIS